MFLLNSVLMLWRLPQIPAQIFFFVKKMECTFFDFNGQSLVRSRLFSYSFTASNPWMCADQFYCWCVQRPCSYSKIFKTKCVCFMRSKFSNFCEQFNRYTWNYRIHLQSIFADFDMCREKNWSRRMTKDSEIRK